MSGSLQQNDSKHIPNGSTNLKQLVILLIPKGNLFKKITLIQWKEEFIKIKRRIFNILIKASNICNILSTTAVSNGLTMVKLRQEFKYRGHVYLKPVRPHVSNHTINFIKTFPLKCASLTSYSFK